MQRQRLRTVGCGLVLLAAVGGAPAPACAQDAQYLGPRGAPARAFPSPGRPVADIVSPTRSLEAKRDANDESGQIVRLMGIKPGMTVGDIGAGSGYHAIRLARVVGRSGIVIAQDVKRDYLAQLAGNIGRQNIQNVRLALGEPHDPRLPPGSLDAAILVHMYHEVAQPYAFLHNLAPSLKAGARVGIVDLDRPTSGHGTPPDVLRCELSAVGYREVAFHRLAGDAGYLAIFEAPSGARQKRPGEIVPCRAKAG
jgi:SAM-dependent methyltransferase